MHLRYITVTNIEKVVPEAVKRGIDKVLEVTPCSESTRATLLALIWYPSSVRISVISYMSKNSKIS